MPIIVHANNFTQEVLNASGPVLVDFFGENCMPCKILQPILVALSQDFTGLKFCMFSTDHDMLETKAEHENQLSILIKYEIMNLPTLLLFVDGEVRASIVGMHSRDELLQFFRDQNVTLTPRLPAI